jgi:hypothetical protein
MKVSAQVSEMLSVVGQAISGLEELIVEAALDPASLEHVKLVADRVRVQNPCKSQ